MWSPDFYRIEWVWTVRFNPLQRLKGIVYYDCSLPPIIHNRADIEDEVRSFKIATWWGTFTFKRTYVERYGSPWPS